MELDQLSEAEKLALLKEKMTDRLWRLENLYKILDERGNIVPFKLNWFQLFLLDNFWYLNVILKARQVGITTFSCILFLDDCLFNKNMAAAIIADSQKHSEEIFRTKVKFAFDNLPEWLKAAYNVDTNTSQQLIFSNGSSISVNTGVRSGTYQRLLVSEFGKICVKYPDKAQEIVTGSFNTVHPGQIIIVESTAEGQGGYFYDICMDAMAVALSGRSLTTLDFKFFFFPWWKVPHYKVEADITISKEKEDYFRKIEAECDMKLSTAQKNWYVLKEKQQGEDMKREYPSTSKESFEQSTEGAYYGKHLDLMRQQKRITNVPHDPLMRVDTWWDLGMNDDMVILFTQTNGREIRIIDCYVNSGEGLAHYAGVLENKRTTLGYVYNSHNAPHDIEVKDMSTGMTRKSIAAGLGIFFRVIPRASIQDGIEAVRSILSRVWLDERNCQAVVNSLQNYRKIWDDKRGVWRNEPMHDEYSHVADALRYLAQGIKAVDNDGYERYGTSDDNKDFDKYNPFSAF